MKKLFKYYILILPAVMLAYGMYMMTYIYREDPNVTNDSEVTGFLQNQMLRGWTVLILAFILLLAYITYQLLENKNWQYIYSFPVTKKKMYREIFERINVSMIIAAVIYGILYMIKLRQISDWDQTKYIALSGFVCIVMTIAKCMLAEVILLSLKHIWQGALAVGIVLYQMLSMIMGNLGYMIQTIFRVKGQNIVFQKIFFGMSFGLKIPVEMTYLLRDNYYNEYVDPGLYDTWSRWIDYYPTVMITAICSFVLISLCLWMIAKRSFQRVELEPKGLVFRFSWKKSRWVVGSVMSLFLFQWITNLQSVGGMSIFGNTTSPRYITAGFLATLLLPKSSLQSMDMKLPVALNTWMALLISVVASVIILFIFRKGSGLYEKHLKA